ALDDDVGGEDALAARLDTGVGGLHQDRQVGLFEKSGPRGGDPGKTVPVPLDLLALVEDVTDVPDGRGDGGGEPQGDGDAALHVAGAEPVDPAFGEPRGQVPGGRDGVQVARDDGPFRAAEVGAGDDRVADALDGEVGKRAQRLLHGV